MLKYCLDRYKTQEMCDKAVDNFLSALKFVPDWFVKSKMIKNPDDAIFSNDIFFFDEDSGNVTFSSNKMGITSVDLNTANLDNVNSDEDDPQTIINFRLMVWLNRLKQCRAGKKDISKESMPVA